MLKLFETEVMGKSIVHYRSVENVSRKNMTYVVRNFVFYIAS